jgi:amino acid adenylation domain-containing protein/thioester reductase-like protein
MPHETLWLQRPPRTRGDAPVVCESPASFVAAVADGQIGTDAVFVAIVACFVGLYNGRDRLRLAIEDCGRLARRRDQTHPRALAIDLSLSAEAPFHQLALATERALRETTLAASDPREDDPPVDGLVRWHEGTSGRAAPLIPLANDRVDLVFAFTDEGHTLRLDAQAKHAAGHRISSAIVTDAIRESVSCLSKNPSMAVGQIEWVSAECRRKVLGTFNGSPVPYDKERTILHLFEACASQAGHRPAVTFCDETLTYAQLDRKANTLAARLFGCGVRAGELVPLLTGGGLELPIAMLAVLKLGAAFVPIDLAWPDERLRVIFGELNPRIAIYNSPTSVRVNSVPSLCFTAARLEETSVRPLHAQPRPDDLIYGFFTSGSTGTPKCALNFHGGLLNRFLAMSRRFGADGNDVVLQNSRPVFDSSIWQLLWPLTSGSRVVIPAAGKLLDLNYTISIIEKYRITMTDFVPAIFNALVDLIEADRDIVSQLRSLRQLLIGGEEIGAQAVQKFRGLLPGCGICNTYGPTEASIGCVFHEVRDEDGWAIPIGRPIDNCYVAITDPRGRIVPPGIVGELLIGGDCLGEGYLNDPVKTGNAFIPNTLPEIPGARLYRTGDLGYHRPDGNIHFIGRQDQQIKLGGIRIELTEIESVIAAHPAVRAVKVIVEGKREESQRLAAYVVAHTDTGPTDIKHAVASSLPACCVPKHVFMIDRMPLNANGKVDRKALTAMAHSPGRASAETLSPVQRRIRTAWLELLAVDSAGLYDDFFTLGGDSLIAVRLGLRLREEFGCRMLARDIFRCPTISAQAAFVESRLERDEVLEGAPPAQTLLAAARLDPDIHVAPGTVLGTPDVVLLTGATGFVGSHLLRSLLLDTAVHVICLIRAANDVAAMARLRETLRHYRLDENGCAERTTAIAGDLALPRLGLSDAVYERLARSVDAIVHNGAAVNLLLDYPALKATNVNGTLEIIRLAVRHKPKRIHYISTLAAVAPDGGASFDETELTAGQLFPALGYGQSKSVAERLLAEARARGVSAVTYRLGEVMPHSRTGIANGRALLDTLIRSCLKLGLSFSSTLRLDYTPVDYIGSFLAAAVTAPPSGLATPVFHVFHPQAQSLERIFESFRKAGFTLRPVSYPAFHTALREACAAPAADPDLLLTLALIPDPRDSDGTRYEDKLFQIVNDAGSRFSCAQTLAAVSRLGVAWPPPGTRALDAYAEFHRREFRRQHEVTDSVRNFMRVQ